MKRYILHIITFLAALLVAQSAWGADLPKTGNLTNNTYTLSANQTQTGTLTVPAGVTATIDLNGKTLTGGSFRFFDVRGTLTIQGNGTITGAKVTDPGGCAYIYEGGKLNLINGTITNCSSTSHGGAVYINGGTFEMSGGIISNCRTNVPTSWQYPSGDNLPDFGKSTTYGGAVYINTIYVTGSNPKQVQSYGKFIMSGGSLLKNIAASGGAVMVWTDSQFEMSGSAKIEGNIACGNEAGGGLGNGGAAYVQGGTFTINGGSLINNRAVRYGGAVNLNQGGQLEIKGACEVSGNIANYGGGLTQEAGLCRMILDKSGIIINNNIAKINGGGLFIEKGVLSIKDATISGNIAGGIGGGAALYVSRIEGDIVANIEGGTSITGNTAGSDGGGIALYADPVAPSDDNKETLDPSEQPDGKSDLNSVFVNFSSGTLEGNTAANGGGIHIYIDKAGNGRSKCEATMNIGTESTIPTIKNNTATTNGGALAMTSGTFNFINGNVSNNNAKLGAGIYLGDGDFTIKDGKFTSNIASQSGGGIYVGSGTFTVNGNTTLNGNKATSTDGGGIYLGGGSFTVSATGSLNLGGATSSEGNTAGSNGGGVYCGATFTVNGTSKIQNNTAKNGGGVYVKEGYSASFAKQVDLTNNKASANGGAIYVNGGNISLAGNSFTGNNAVQGGAVYLTGGSLTVSGDSQIKNNYSTDKGGAFYVNGGTVTLTSATISGNGKNGSNVTTTSGGAIYVTGSGAGLSATGTVNVSGNAANTNGGALYVNGGSITLVENTFANNNAKVGGAVYQEGGSLTASENSTIQNNYSTAEGGAFYVTGGKVQLASATISGNGKNGSSVTTTDGGAIYVTGSGAGFTAGGTTTISSNSAVTNGGAIYVKGGNVTLAQNEISSNSSANGGAIYLETGSFTASGSTTMNSNAATINGGAVYVMNGNIKITGSSSILNLSQNHADAGGAFYVNGGDIDASEISSATISNNYSTGEGGAFYVNTGEISMCKTEMSGNGKAGSEIKTTNGGAIALYNGTFSFGDDSVIKTNAASENGGGLYISNESVTAITCVGGSYEENIANLGGGIYASGPINLTFAANVENNRATNGGGLYLDGGVNMTFGYIDNKGTASTSDDEEISGLIVRNEANGTGTDGVGGGIYLNEGTLSFAATENLGIYNNAASYEAADIFASGSNTTIRLPYVKDLNLTGFDVPGSELYWVKDFYENNETTTFGRYEAALRNTDSNIEAMILGFESSEQAAKVKVITNVKTCLDLGYDLVFVTFTPVNLATGDNAAIVIYYPESRTYGSDGIITAVTGTKQYRKLLLTGDESQTIGLPSGYWYFDTTGWTYAYADNPVFSPASGSSFTKFLKDSNDDTKTFVEIKRNQDQDIKLTFTPKTNPEFKAVVKYSTMLINKMRPGGSSTH